MCKHYNPAQVIKLSCEKIGKFSVKPDDAKVCWNRKWKSDIEEPCEECPIKVKYAKKDVKST